MKKSSCKGKGMKWSAINGAGGVITCYDQSAWRSRGWHIIHRSCMLLGKDYGKPFLSYREDFQHCRDDQEVLKNVRKDRNAIGFVLFHGKPIKGVKILAIGKTDKGPFNRKKGTAGVLSALSIDPEGIAFVNFADLPADPDKLSIKVLAIGRADKAVRPTSRTIMSGDYPFSRRLYLYVSPKASVTTREFIKFVLSGTSAPAFGKHGLVPSQVTPPTTQPASRRPR